METCKIYDNKKLKVIQSNEFNCVFSKETGFTATWGKTKEEDAQYSPFGPLILDIEITTICHGVPGSTGIKSPCRHCYKSNGPVGHNMSLETFKKILDKMPKTLTQLAMGADADCTANPDIWKMMEYSRSKGIIPNITVANITDETADNLVKYCGAVSVSRYANKNLCYDSVKKLTDRGLKQCNVHQLISQETFEQAKETLSDAKSDPRLAGLNAIVLLSLKQKGRGVNYGRLTQEQFKELVDYSFANNIRIGFDSCGCNKFIRSIKKRDDYDKIAETMSMCAEPCESFGLFSCYIDVNGTYFPCSFAPGTNDWEQGIPVVDCQDFIKDVWMSEKLDRYRKLSLKTVDENGYRKCLLFEI